MSAPEFQEFTARLLPEYAADHVRAGNWSQEEALGRAQGEFKELLPQGADSPDQYLLTALSVPGGFRVGELWYAIRPMGTHKQLFIYWIGISPIHRRRGHAAEILRGLEGDARRHGATEIALHVFGSNAAAIGLYDKLGFLTTNRIMSKPIPK